MIPLQVSTLVELQYLYAADMQQYCHAIDLAFEVVHARDLESKQLDGSIPAQISALVKLNFMYAPSGSVAVMQRSSPFLLSQAYLKVTCNCRRLKSRQLSGSIPPQVSILTNLNYMYALSARQQTLPLSCCSHASQCSTAQRADACRHLELEQLSGSIPSQISALIKLQLLYPIMRGCTKLADCALMQDHSKEPPKWTPSSNFQSHSIVVS